MKRTNITGMAALTACALLAAVAQAAQWNQTGGTHDWNDDGNWTAPAVYPDAPGAVADLTADLTAAQTINLIAGVTVGQINIGDAAGTNFSYSVGPNTQTIDLDNNGSAAQINNVAGFNFIRADLVATGANNDVNVDVATGTILQLGDASLLGTSANIGKFTKTGGGQLNIGFTTSVMDPDVQLQGGLTAILLHQSLPEDGVVTFSNGARLQTGGGRQQFVAEVRGNGVLTAGTNQKLVVGDALSAPVASQNGVIIADQGIVRPGDITGPGEIGTFFLSIPSPASNPVTINPGANFYFDIASLSSFDQINSMRVYTTVDGGNIHLNFIDGFHPVGGDSFDLFINTSTKGYVDGTPGTPIFDSITYSGLGGGGFVAELANFTNDGEGGGFKAIRFTYLPEPGSAMLLVCGALLLRRRKC